MAENQNNGGGDNGERKAAQDSNDMSNNLPMVVAPKLGAGEEDIDETAAEAAAEAAAPPARTHSRFLMLAGSVAFAAAFAAFIGSVSGSGLARYLYAPAPLPAAEMTASTADALREMKLKLADLSAIKAELDAASRGTASQFAKIADRLDRLDQHVASATSDTTGSIAAAAPAAAESAAPVETPKVVDRIVPGWVVQDVQDGRALVESRYGVFDVGAGSFLPGVGRVDAVKRQDGQWVVLTARGTITSGR